MVPTGEEFISAGPKSSGRVNLTMPAIELSHYVLSLILWLEAREMGGGKMLSPNTRGTRNALLG
jgi:hypothetical protein